MDIIPLRPKLWIQLLEQSVGRDDALLENEDRFEHACKAAPTLQMADIGFYRADVEWCAAGS